MNTPIPPADSGADELLALRCQLGERDAFDALITRWHEPLWRYLRRVAGNDDVASDLMQDTWIRVLRGIVHLRDPASLRPWLFGIARHVAMDRLRHLYQWRPAADVDLCELPAPDEELAIDMAAIEAVMQTLPLIDREPLTLFHSRELSIEQIASLLEIPVGTVKSRLFRARRALRTALEKSGVLP